MRFSLVALSFATLAACGPSVAAPGSLAATIEVTAPAEDTQVLAVLSYASWCGSCKVLDPKVEAVRSAHAFDGVEFFALDYSAKDEAAYFADAQTLGIADTMRTVFPDGIGTGRLYLIDRATGSVIDTVSKSMSEAEIATAINDALS
ncbi:MAG: thioredoxin domain-containing protein [Hyphomonas sp.]|nr:thioredoxin domain-containing protein [Hyphomonas sp.]